MKWIPACVLLTWRKCLQQVQMPLCFQSGRRRADLSEWPLRTGAPFLSRSLLSPPRSALKRGALTRMRAQTRSCTRACWIKLLVKVSFVGVIVFFSFFSGTEIELMINVWRYHEALVRLSSGHYYHPSCTWIIITLHVSSYLSSACFCLNSLIHPFVQVQELNYSSLATFHPFVTSVITPHHVTIVNLASWHDAGCVWAIGQMHYSLNKWAFNGLFCTKALF